MLVKLTPEHNCHKTQHLLSQVILQSKKENKIVTQIIDKSLRIEKDTKLVLPQFSFKLSKDCFAKLLLLLQSCSCCCCKIVVVAISSVLRSTNNLLRMSNAKLSGGQISLHRTFY